MKFNKVLLFRLAINYSLTLMLLIIYGKEHRYFSDYVMR